MSNPFITEKEFNVIIAGLIAIPFVIGLAVGVAIGHWVF